MSSFQVELDHLIAIGEYPPRTSPTEDDPDPDAADAPAGRRDEGGAAGS